MKYAIKNRFTLAVMFEAEIDCADDAPMSLKIGLAARWAAQNKVSMRGAYIQGADMQNADMQGAHMQGADMQGANMRGAYMQGAYMQGAYMQGANMRGADMRGADMQNTYMQGADMRGADMRGADMQGADMQGADMQGANMQGVNMLAGDKISRLIARATRLDGYEFFAFLLTDDRVKVLAGCRWFTIEEYRAHVAAKYPDTDKARETTDILDFIERRVAAVKERT